ncbi:polyprenol monophosphomannose synthase [Litorilinea aerophila]|nr:polyprenol monophosphomannose synthase [Litorilinea aerophila]MCC9074570.1 polyprenol monophosphomannose synthase [Litorilinea aerophila]
MPTVNGAMEAVSESIRQWTDPVATEIALTVVIPTYNEADNLPAMAEALFALPFRRLQLLVVDDNSPDGTGAVADQLAARYNAPENNPGLEAGGNQPGERRPRMVVLHRRRKAGLGTAYVVGMQRALADGAEYVVQMDADFSHSPRYIPQMVGVMLATGADVVIGSRYVPGGTLDEGWGWWRRFMSWWANLYSRMILGLRIRDMTAGFKLWRREALLGIGLENIRSNGYSFQVEMAYLCEKLGYRIIEIPIHFEDRRIGQSKLDVPVKLESAWRTWQIRWRYRHIQREPLPLLESVPGAVADPAQPLSDSRTPFASR